MERPTTASGLARPPSSYANRPRTARALDDDGPPRTSRPTTAASRARPPSVHSSHSQTSSRPFTRARGMTATGARQDSEQAGCVARLRAKRAAVQCTNETLQAQLDQLEKAAVQHQKRKTYLTNLHAEIDTMQTTLAQHNLIIDAVIAKTPIDALQRELQALIQRNESAEEALQHTLEQRAAVEDGTRGLQLEAERLQEVMAAQFEALPEQHRADLEALQAEVQRLEHAVVGAQQGVATLEHQVALAKQGAPTEAAACIKILEDIDALRVKKQSMLHDDNTNTPHGQRQKLLDAAKADNDAAADAQEHAQAIQGHIKQLEAVVNGIQETSTTHTTPTDTTPTPLPPPPTMAPSPADVAAALEALHSHLEAATAAEEAEALQRRVLRQKRTLEEKVLSDMETTAAKVVSLRQADGTLGTAVTKHLNSQEQEQLARNDQATLRTLSTKLQEQITSSQSRITKLQESIQELGAVEGIRQLAEAQAKQLQANKAELQQQLAGLQPQVNNLQKQLEQAQAQLRANPRHVTLKKLEDAITALETEHASLVATIELRHQQGNVGPLLASVVELSRQVQALLHQRGQQSTQNSNRVDRDDTLLLKYTAKMQRYGVVQPSSRTISSPRESVTDEKTITPLSAVQILRSGTIDLSSLRLDAGVIEANVFAWTAAFHPTQTKVAVATQGCITEYDIISGCKMDSVELPLQTPVNLQYLGDNITLAFVTKERHLMTFNWVTRRLRTLYVAGDTKGDTHAMTHMHLAVFMGIKPVMFVSKHGSQAVRMVLPPTARPKASDGKGKEKGGGKSSKEDSSKDGLKCYVAQKKPIIGIAPHPALSDVVLVAFSDGSLAACQFVPKQSTLATLWTIAVDPDVPQLMRAALKAERHPFNPRASLLVCGTNTGALSVWEVPDAGEPRKLGHFDSSDGTALVGAGIITTSCLLVCFLKNIRGNLTCKAWRINSTPSGGTLLAPLDTTPTDVWAAVDGATPHLQADNMTDATFWTSLRSTQHAASFAQFQGNARNGYDVARIVIHPQGYLMAQMLPLKELLPLRTKMAEKIDAGSLEAVQRVLHAPIMRLWDAMHPPNGSLAPDVVPLHLDLEFWTPQSDDDTTNTKLRLIFPKDVTMLDAEAVRQYNLMGDSLNTLAQFPRTSSLLARRIVHSEKHKAWLIFFSSKTAKNVAQPESGDSEYALILQAHTMQLSMGGMETSPGLAGTFCGPNDDLFAVLGNDMRLVSVFQTLNARTPLAVVQLPGAGGDSLYNAGALMAARAQVEPPGTPDEATEGQQGGGEQKKKKKKKKGEEKEPGPLGEHVWLLWSHDGALELGNAAAASGRVVLPPGTPPLPKGVAQLGTITSDRAVLLNATEKVLQVCWQPLGPQAPGSLAHPQGTPDHACLGAVVTSERIVVVDGDLRLLASNSPHDKHVQVLSCVWAGPALFFSTSAEEVYQFSWGGSPVRCFALSNGAPCTLAGALVDRLLVATRVGGVTEVMLRYFDIGPALLVGWAGLAASGAMTDGVSKARKAMTKILMCYDSSGIEPQQLAALADAGFADVALQIIRAHFAMKIEGGRHASNVERCKAEANALVKEYEASPYRPGPPPRGSILYHRLVRCGRKSTLCCAFSAARNCFAAAGQVLELIPVLVALNDKGALRNIAEAVEVEATMMMDCADIATLLYTVPPHILNAVKLDTDPIGNSTYDGSFNQVWGGEDIAAPGTQPTMLAAYSQSDRGSILPLDRTALKHWVEVEGVHIGGPRGPPGAQTSRGPSEPGTPPPEFEFEEGNTTPRSGVTPGGSFTMQDNEKWSSDEDDAAPRSGTTSRMSKAPSPRERGGDGETGDSSEDDDAPAQPKFRITIKSKDEARTAGNSDITRAAQSLKTIKWAGGAPSSSMGGGGLPFLPAPGTLGGLAPQRTAPLPPPMAGGGLRPPPIQPPVPPGGGGPASGAPSSGPSPPADGNNVDALLDFLGGGPAWGGGPAANRPPTPSGLDLFNDIPGAQSSGASTPGGRSTPNAPQSAIQRSGSSSSVGGATGQAYEAGMTAMAAGNYDTAATMLSRAWDGVSKEAKSGNTGALSQFNTMVHAIAGARLMVAAARATQSKAARYSRFASGLSIPDEARVPVVREAVKFNMKVGNYGVANELLLWLVTIVSGNASQGVLNEIQQQLAQCESHGGANSAIPKGEDLAGFASTLSTCRKLEDVDKKLRPVLTG